MLTAPNLPVRELAVTCSRRRPPRLELPVIYGLERSFDMHRSGLSARFSGTELPSVPSGRSGKARLGALLVALGVTALGPLAMSAPVSAAAHGCGTLPSDNNVYVGRAGSCSGLSISKPYVTFGDGELVDMAMGPNSVFSPRDALGGDIEAIECEYNNGSGLPGDPPNALDFCDAQTIGADFPFTVESNGAFDYMAESDGGRMKVFALPGKYLKTATITCNATHACVWYVGENYNSFASPHLFSNPFYVAAAPSSPSSFPTLVVVLVVVIVVLGMAAYVVVRRRPRSSGRAR